MKNVVSLFSLAFIAGMIYVLSILTGGCAQIMMPTGGPKDTLPPVLLNATPPSGTTHFDAKRITLTFDEYIQLDNPFQNVLVSPMPKKNPFIDYKLKTVTVRIYDTLQPDKTYSIQFGKTIKDLNEGNPFTGYNYVFSTGDKVDSLGIGGRVILAETGEVDSTLTVLLHSDLGDSAIYKHKPEYIARLDTAGKFLFRFLSPGDYHIFVLKDESGQLIYNNPQQLFAFDNDTIRLSEHASAPEIMLYAYQAEKSEEKPAPATKDTVLKVSNNLESGALDLLQPLVLTFSNAIGQFDSGRVLLTDTLFNRIQGVHFSVDTTLKKISLKHDWPSETDFRLIIPEDAVADTNGHHLAKNDTLKFKTRSTTDYGSIRMNFSGLNHYKNPVLQLWKDKAKYGSFPVATSVFERKLIPPGKYFILILEDTNGNGKWDPGNYAERLQPEIVHRLQEPITIRANWENEKDIDLSRTNVEK